MQLNWSRIIAVISLVATILSFGASFLGQLDPQYAVIALALSSALNAFTERVQGGASVQ